MTLLAEAPAGRHFAQFHRNCDSLSESLSAFLEGGIRRGHSAVVIATPELRDSLVARLAADKFHPKALAESGQLDLIDAVRLMAQLMPNGAPAALRGSQFDAFPAPQPGFVGEAGWFRLY